MSHRVHRVFGPKQANNLRDLRNPKRLEGAGERIRIILLASGDLWAGAEAVVFNLAKGLKDYPSVKLMVVILNEGKLADLCKMQGINTHIISENKYNFPILVWQLRRLIRDYRPHIVHSHRYKENVLALLARLPLSGSPKLVTTIHGLSEGHSKLKTRIAAKLDLLALRFFFNRIVAVSGEIAQNLIQIYSIPSHKIATIHNGIEMPEEPIARKGKKDVITIGSAGRLFPVKDYLLMVDIAKDLCARRDNVHFVLAGDGPEREKILLKIQEYGISDRFKLLGHLDDMEEFYSTIDIYLNTSHHEGLPMTIIEAMVHSIPVVAPELGGFPEVVEHEKTGWLVKNRNANEFTRIINDVTSNNGAMAVAGENSRERVQKYFSIGCMSESYVNMYMDLR